MRPGRGGGGVATKLMAGGAGGGPTPPSLWRTPTPYLFLGFALMMGVIAVALLVLICMRKKAPSAGEKAAASAPALVPLDREPKFVVFMPGDHHAPSFLAVASARPLASVVAHAPRRPTRGAEEDGDGTEAV